MIHLNVSNAKTTTSVVENQAPKITESSRTRMNGDAQTIYGPNASVVKCPGNMRHIIGHLVGVAIDVSRVPNLRIYPDWNHEPQSLLGKAIIDVIATKSYTYLITIPTTQLQEIN